ncbi:Syn2, partial [Acrasis kona]
MNLLRKMAASKSSDNSAEEVQVDRPVSAPKVQINVLVIDANDVDWDKLFADANHQKYDFKVEQCMWRDIQSVTSYNEYKKDKNTRRCLVQLKGVLNAYNTTRRNTRTFQPDFAIVRKLVIGLKSKSEDYTVHLQGFLHAQVPAVNSFESVYMNLQRPFVHGALGKLRDRLGFENFPLIDQFMYSDARSMLFHPTPPLVLKVGTADAGYGKIKIGSKDNKNISDELRDIAGTITRYDDFITAESFIEGKTHDIRVQKIGSHFRAYKRVSSNWKGNVGSSILTEIEVLPRYKSWANKVSDELFGDHYKMDILTVDAVGVGEEGQEYILEINDTASGFASENKLSDNVHVRDLAINKIENIFNYT